MKKTLLTVLTIILTTIIGAHVANAVGSLTPIGTAGDDTYYSVNDIFNKLTDFTNTHATTVSPFVTPGNVEATFQTLSDVYALLEAENTDLVPENIADGVEIFGVEGTKQDGVIYSTDWSSYVATTTRYSWATAVAYCDSLEEGDYTNWRLPTYIELVNMYLTAAPGNSLNFQSGNHWSSTEVVGNAGFAHLVNPILGTSIGTNKTLATFYARCVR